MTETDRTMASESIIITTTDDNNNRGFRMVERRHQSTVTGGTTMLTTTPLLNEVAAEGTFSVTMNNFRRVDEVFSDGTFTEQHLNFQRQINLEYLQAVYNRRAPVTFGSGADGQRYLYLSALGMLLPVEILSISPNEFSGRMATEIGEFLEIMHATVLISSFSEHSGRQSSSSRQQPSHIVDFDKLHQTRFKKAYKDDFHFCTICQNDFKSNQKIVVLHEQCAFHRDCITEWLKRKPTCPNCNAIVPHRATDGRTSGVVFTV